MSVSAPTPFDWTAFIASVQPSPFDIDEHLKWRALHDHVASANGDMNRVTTRDTPTHATSSAIVLSSAGVLLHFHKRLGRWLQPGGHIDANEYPADAAIRETFEETGVTAWHPRGTPQVVHIDDHMAGDHRHLDVLFALVADPVDPTPPANESPLVRWVPLKELTKWVDTDAEPRLSLGISRATVLLAG